MASEAQCLLLDVGYRRLEPRVMRAYEKLIPPSAILEKQLAGCLNQLKSSSTALRLRAVRYIDAQARCEPTVAREAWLKDPRTTTPLLEALQDIDPRVIEEAACALAMICSRYFQDMRAYKPLVELLKSPRAVTRLAAVEGIGLLFGDDCLQHMLPLLQDKSAKVRAETCRRLYALGLSGSLSTRQKKETLPWLVRALNDDNTAVRNVAASALREVGGKQVIPFLKTALATEKNSGLRASLAYNLERLAKSKVRK